MIEDKDYMEFLNRIIACVSNGDYFAVKELSKIELEKLKNNKNNKDNN